MVGSGLTRGLPLAALSLLVFAGCREQEAEFNNDHDLGSDGRILLSVGSARKDARIVAGQAQWPAFRKPSSDAKTAKTQGALTKARRGEIEADVRALIDEYNEIPADDGVDALLDYYVEEQHETLRPALEAALSLTAKLNDVCSQLASKLADEKGRVDTACEALRAMHTVALRIEALAVISANEVELTVASTPDPRKAQAVLVDGDWYVKVADMAPFETLKPMVEMSAKSYGGMLQLLSESQTPPADILTQLEQAVKLADSAGDADG